MYPVYQFRPVMNKNIGSIPDLLRTACEHLDNLRAAEQRHCGGSRLSRPTTHRPAPRRETGARVRHGPRATGHGQMSRWTTGGAQHGPPGLLLILRYRLFGSLAAPRATLAFAAHPRGRLLRCPPGLSCTAREMHSGERWAWLHTVRDAHEAETPTGHRPRKR